jgi:alpha-D-ribose 1-methylphosphonate 5-triphosphate synthase subunit PhnG
MKFIALENSCIPQAGLALIKGREYESGTWPALTDALIKDAIKRKLIEEVGGTKKDKKDERGRD